MGSALAKSLAKNHDVRIYNRHPEKALKLEQQGHGKACVNLQESIADSDIVFLAVKPQALDEVGQLLNFAIPNDVILISLLAGTPIAKLMQHFYHNTVLRMMPNLAISVGCGLIGMASNDNLSEKTKENISLLLEPLGTTKWIEEVKMDAFTALASSGPAFIFAIVESVIEAGIGMGFNAKDSQEIVYQMMLGSLKLLEETQLEPGELKRQIASPKGTTIAGLQKFEEHAIRGNLINTFFAAYERSKEMNK